ncbi:MAG TPA: tannase/feruloyl esterase family alpha/beta hydrolase, partial [Acidobacteriota bacterium]|nr:tannase/feruloyl esterase family alpha/beta hydrolase [Acidobacteriota bacterium]
MKVRILFCAVAGLGIALILSGATAFAQSSVSGSCEKLMSVQIPETTISSAKWIAAGEFSPPGRGIALGGGQPPFGAPPGAGRGAKPEIGRGPAGTLQAVPAFCRVVGVVQPSINFEVWLPPASGENKWNGKFNGVGNGGMAGFIAYDAMMQALARGYATASTDTGHVEKRNDDSWALDEKLVVDFASRGIHMTAVAAKAVIRAYYSRDPQYSYFTGCSGGGGQALSEAQRYPADYNGIVAGAPANYPTHLWPGELYAAWVTHRDEASRIPNDKLPLIVNAALDACDAADGVKDGVINDPRQCNFDPAKIQCSGADGPNCLTAAQADSVRKIYEGAKDPSTGKRFWYGYEKSSETLWPGHINEPFNTPISYFKYMVLKNPNWDWKSLSFSDPKSFALLEESAKKFGPVLDSINPDLTRFEKRGGKLILYHGWLDQNISPRNTIQYFESVQKTMGGPGKTEEFVRLFMAPGMA